MTMGRRVAVWVFVCAVGVWLAPAAGAASAFNPSPSDFFPLREVKPGMTGVGRTVFHGTEIEEFGVKVVGVLEGIDLGWDVILIEITSGYPVDQKTGVIAGMSGSPIYLDGKIAGALSLRFTAGGAVSGNLLAGVTPIEEMIANIEPKADVARMGEFRPRTPLRLGAEELASAVYYPGGDPGVEVSARTADGADRDAVAGQRPG